MGNYCIVSGKHCFHVIILCLRSYNSLPPAPFTFLEKKLHDVDVLFRAKAFHNLLFFSTKYLFVLLRDKTFTFSVFWFLTNFIILHIPLISLQSHPPVSYSLLKPSLTFFFRCIWYLIRKTSYNRLRGICKPRFLRHMLEQK